MTNQKQKNQKQFSTEVLFTTDYSRFKTLLGNRDMNELHLKRLTESFKENYLFSPILVNEKYQIIDGQHRFNTAKALNLPIYYLMAYGYGINEVQILNTNSSNWTSFDYLKMYCDKNVEPYLQMNTFMESFPEFGIKSTIKFLTNDDDDDNKKFNSRAKDFQNGKLIIPNIKLSYKYAKEVLKFKPYFDGYSRNTFVGAIISLLKNPNYDNDEMISKLVKNPSALYPATSITQYKLIIEEVYNFRRKVKVNLRY
jgi:hypothetical protein